MTLSGNLTANALSLTQSGALVVSGTTTLGVAGGSDIFFNLPGNNFGTFAVTSGRNVQVTDSNLLDLGAINIGGNLTATATIGNITNTGGTLTIGGTASFLASGANASILVNHAGNTFASTVNFIGGALQNVSITDADASPLQLQGLTLLGDLNVTATGGITQ